MTIWHYVNNPTFTQGFYPVLQNDDFFLIPLSLGPVLAAGALSTGETTLHIRDSGVGHSLAPGPVTGRFGEQVYPPWAQAQESDLAAEH